MHLAHPFVFAGFVGIVGLLLGLFLGHRDDYERNVTHTTTRVVPPDFTTTISGVTITTAFYDASGQRYGRRSYWTTRVVGLPINEQRHYVDYSLGQRDFDALNDAVRSHNAAIADVRYAIKQLTRPQ